MYLSNIPEFISDAIWKQEKSEMGELMKAYLQMQLHGQGITTVEWRGKLHWAFVDYVHGNGWCNVLGATGNKDA